MAEAELTTIARPYARAAFTYALEKPDGLRHWSNMLGLLAEAINNPVMSDALDNPVLTTDDETALLTGLLGDDLSNEGRNFLSVLAEYGRLTLIPTIAHLYELFKANHEKTMEVEVTSAFEVSEGEKEVLGQALHKMLNREISISTSVDKSLIGGVIIRAEDTVIDDSVRGRLAKLSQVLG